MRAGPLSDKAVIQILNDNFVNTWVLKGSLQAQREKGATADTRRLADDVFEARQEKSPVDCLVMSSDLGLVAVQPVHDILQGPFPGWPKRYREFLTGALEKANK